MRKAIRSLAMFGAISAFGFSLLQSCGHSDQDKLRFKSGNDICVLELCSDNILKVDYQPNGEVSPGTPVVDETKNWEPVNASIDLQKDPMEIRTSAMLVKISKATLKVSVYDSTGTLLISTKEVNPKGGITFKHEPADNFYGIYTYGSHSNDGTLLRNKVSTIQAFPQGGSGAPFIWSTRGTAWW